MQIWNWIVTHPHVEGKNWYEINCLCCIEWRGGDVAELAIVRQPDRMDATLQSCSFEQKTLTDVNAKICKISVGQEKGLFGVVEICSTT